MYRKIFKNGMKWMNFHICAQRTKYNSFRIFTSQVISCTKYIFLSGGKYSKLFAVGRNELVHFSSKFDPAS